MTKPVVLITGAAKRIGAAFSRAFHQQGFNVAIHYGRSKTAAEQLSDELNSARANSAIALPADLNQHAEVLQLAQNCLAQWQRVDLLINNASSFFPTHIGSSGEDDWDQLINSNLKAPYFLSQALAPALQKQGGSIINLADIHGDKPMAGHAIYNIAKAGNIMLTKTLAKELAPAIRVNGIAPGAIAWPEATGDEAKQQAKQQTILDKSPLQRLGGYANIVAAALYLSTEASYTSGQILSVDGGRSLSM